MSEETPAPDPVGLRRVPGLGLVPPHTPRCAECGAAHRPSCFDEAPFKDDAGERTAWCQNLPMFEWTCPSCAGGDR